MQKFFSTLSPIHIVHDHEITSQHYNIISFPAARKAIQVSELSRYVTAIQNCLYDTSYVISFSRMFLKKTRLYLTRGHYRYALMDLSLDLRINEKLLKENAEMKKGK
jgi:hypothetical protein